MQIRIISMFAVCFLALVGCDGHKPKMTTEDGSKWFQKNKKELFELKELLLKHPVIKRVDPGSSREYVENYATFSTEDRVAYDYLEKRCNALQIYAIKNWRSSKNPESLAIVFIIDRHGIAVSGCAISVEYTNNKRLLKATRDSGDTIEPLDIEDWYVVYTES